MFKEALQEGELEAINSIRNWTGTVNFLGPSDLYSATCNELALSYTWDMVIVVVTAFVRHFIGHGISFFYKRFDSYS